MEDFYKKIEKICQKDKRYKPDAYEFIMRALSFTQKKLKRIGHITGKEFCYGIRDLALEEFGPLARTVLEYWGLKTTLDFGRVVYNMIEENLMAKTPQDSLEDFKDVFDFYDAFDKKIEFKLEE